MKEVEYDVHQKISDKGVVYCIEAADRAVPTDQHCPGYGCSFPGPGIFCSGTSPVRIGIRVLSPIIGG